jgi:hypothetical protein
LSNKRSRRLIWRELWKQREEENKEFVGFYGKGPQGDKILY